MRRNITLRFLASTILVLMAIVVNAQDANNPWHLIANEGGKEVAAYNADSIVDLKLSTANVTVVFQGQSFDHPRTAVRFGVAPRRNGTGTANEVITSPGWNVYYANGRLNFSEAVNGISVHSITGALVSKSAGSYTSFPVNLASGIYIVQTGNKAAKLLVDKGGFGGSISQPVAETRAAASTYSFDAPVETRSTGIKNYLNITAGKSTVSISMAEIKELYFTPDNSLVCIRKDGSTIEFQEYKGMVPSNTPVPAPTSGWLLTETLVYGGCTYAWRLSGISRTIVFAAVHKDGIAFRGISLDGTADLPPAWFPNSNISSAMWNTAKANPGSRLSVFVTPYRHYGITYSVMNGSRIGVTGVEDGSYGQAVVEDWTYNGKTNLIPTTVVQNADGSITMSCKDFNGKIQAYTFVNP